MKIGINGDYTNANLAMDAPGRLCLVKYGFRDFAYVNTTLEVVGILCPVKLGSRGTRENYLWPNSSSGHQYSPSPYILDIVLIYLTSS